MALEAIGPEDGGHVVLVARRHRGAARRDGRPALPTGTTAAANHRCNAKNHAPTPHLKFPFIVSGKGSRPFPPPSKALQSQERARALSPHRAKLGGAPHTPFHSSGVGRIAPLGERGWLAASLFMVGA